MTRKTAILQAIELISENDAKEKLYEILNDLYISEWTYSKTIDSFEQYLFENNNIFPNVRDLGNGILPTKTVLKKYFGTASLIKIHDEYFPKSTIYHYTQSDKRTEDEYKKMFRDTYRKIKQYLNKNIITEREYNWYRGNTPSTKIYMNRLKCKTFVELSYKCGARRNRSYNINTTNNNDSSIESNVIKEIIQNNRKKMGTI